MNKLIILFSAVVFVATLACAPAQTTPIAGVVAAQEASTTPAPNIRYEKKPGPFKACVARVAAFKDKPCDIIFIGDSITDRWLIPGKEIWEKRCATRHALNFGCFADTTQNVLWRFDNLDVKDLKPKVAVILIGTNNTKDKPQEIADGIKAVIAKTRALFSGVKIILVSIMPNQRAEDTMMAANSIIKGFADNETVYWLDLVPMMTPVTTTTPDGKTDTNWKGLGSDHLHPDASGYQLWSDAMEPRLTQLLAGGTK